MNPPNSRGLTPSASLRTSSPLQWTSHSPPFLPLQYFRSVGRTSGYGTLNATNLLSTPQAGSFLTPFITHCSRTLKSLSAWEHEAPTTGIITNSPSTVAFSPPYSSWLPLNTNTPGQLISANAQSTTPRNFRLSAPLLHLPCTPFSLHLWTTTTLLHPHPRRPYYQTRPYSTGFNNSQRMGPSRVTTPFAKLISLADLSSRRPSLTFSNSTSAAPPPHLAPWFGFAKPPTPAHTKMMTNRITAMTYIMTMQGQLP